MTLEERNIKLKHFITCLKCEVNGKCCDENCSTQYDAGNMGEIIENLEAISKILEQEPCEDCINRQAAQAKLKSICDNYNIGYDDRLGGSAYAFSHAFDDLPPVTPQMGRWTHNKCDKCGASRPPLFDNYCPNCGTKMMART